jgi:predicted transglutaminase-like cysteine proteinase
MAKVPRILFAAANVALLCLGACAAPNAASTFPSVEPPAAKLPASWTSAAPPPGYIGFCIRFPDQCKTPQTKFEPLALTSANWKLISDTNYAVNREIWPEEDQKHYGRGEYWTIPTDGYGDCEDISLTKRKRLMDAGLPEGALRIAVVETPGQETHAVLTVVTDKGDFVLDNMRQDIVTWDKSGYQWIERQDPALPTGWASLAPRNMMVASAASATETRSIEPGPAQ